MAKTKKEKKIVDRSILYVIQRKVDGKYWDGWESWYSNPNNVDRGWTTDLLLTRKFKNVSGAKNSRGWVGNKLVKNDACPLCIAGREHPANHWDHTRWVPMEEHELPYKVVSIKAAYIVVEENGDRQ